MSDFKIDPNIARLRVLVAEDYWVNQKVVVKMLKRFGIEPTVVENGQMAVDAALAQDFDLVLMDCQMPVLDGFGATKRIRELETTRGRRTPIVAMTAYSSGNEEAEARQVGMDGWIEKPIIIEVLEKALREHAPAPH